MTKPILTESYPATPSPRTVTGQLKLVASTTGDAVGYATASGVSVAGVIRVKLDSSGALKHDDGTSAGVDLTVNPNSGTTADVINDPTGTRWELTLRFPGQAKIVRYLAVPDDLSTYQVADVLSFAPTSLAIPMAATGVSFIPSGALTATTVQAAIVQAASGVGAGTVTSVNGRTGVVTGLAELRQPITSKVAAYTVTTADGIILADGAAGAFAVTLPTAVGISGQSFVIKRQNSGANTVTVATTGGQSIDGATSFVLTMQYEALSVVSDGANWSVI